MKRIWLMTVLMILAVTGVSLADEIRGKISAVDAEKNFLQISGVTIKANDAWIENERDYPLTLDQLALGDYIEVKGKFSGLSEIRAKKIDQKNPECDVVEGKITSIDTKKREIVISGITIKIPAETWLEGPNQVRIPLELFALGYSVECRGTWTKKSEFTAFKVVVD